MTGRDDPCGVKDEAEVLRQLDVRRVKVEVLGQVEGVGGEVGGRRGGAAGC